MKVLNAEEMYEYEQSIMEDKGVPSILLMEAASQAIASQMKKIITKEDNILLVSGSGNNGGDGIAVGRILHNEGYKTEVIVVGDPSSISAQNHTQQIIAQNYGVPIYNDLEKVKFENYTVLVDSLFGIGLSRPVEGDAEKAIEKINKQDFARVYAIDVPSGISAKSGEVLGTCVKANETITFGFYKHGMQKEELKKYFGKITVDDIGFFY